ncbi:MAG: outer membrane protein assembly factor BamB family protein, partial [Planctomycetota bacterium]
MVRAWRSVGLQSMAFLCLVVTIPCGAVLEAADAPESRMARRFLGAAGVEGGFVVHLGCGDGRLTAALRADDRYLVQGLSADAASVEKARRHVESLGLCGKVSVDRLTGPRLPYVENLASLVVAEDLDGVPIEEVMRVLAPEGVAYVKQDDGWKKLVKPRPTEIDDWTHYLHDAAGNAVAADREVGPPKHVRWVAGPLWSRSHEFNPSINGLVSAGGRMFYILDEGMTGLTDLRFPARWALYARDAFSGLFLWKRPVPNWGYREWNTRGMWSAPLTLNRRVVTDGERVFATLGYKAPVTVLDAATGDEIRTMAGTLGTDEIVLADGVLLLCVREQLSVASPPKPDPKRRRRLNPHEYTIGPPGPAAIVALDAESGRELWRLDPQPVTILTLAALDGRVCFHGADGVTCLDLKTGQRKWAAPSPPAGGSRHSGGTLVMYEDVVLFTSKEGLTALSAADGEKLWTGPRVSGPGISHPPDLFVAGGLVWGGDTPGMHSRERTAVKRDGYDLKTGKVRRTVDVAQLFSPLHHVRCYRSKATDRFLLLPKRGIEFFDLEGGDHMRNDWLRAMCHYGVMPCNGLLYVPPSHCFCYPGVKMTGFLALAAEKDGRREATSEGDSPGRLERGPVLAAGGPRSMAGRDDWPTYRRDPARSGHTPTAVPASLESAWQTELGGKVSPPVIAGGKVYVAHVDAHRVVCLDAESGDVEWAFTAGARVDSPPTIHEGLVLFGCCDGWVYCLRAADGQLAWRFRAAPEDRRIVAFEQVESPWPVPGSVLVLDGVA